MRFNNIKRYIISIAVALLFISCGSSSSKTKDKDEDKFIINKMTDKMWYLSSAHFPQDVAISKEEEPYFYIGFNTDSTDKINDVLIGGFGGCNNFSGVQGTVTKGDDNPTIKISKKPIAVTEMACQQPYLHGLEDRVLDLLSDEDTVLFIRSGVTDILVAENKKMETSLTFYNPDNELIGHRWALAPSHLVEGASADARPYIDFDRSKNSEGDRFFLSFNAFLGCSTIFGEMISTDRDIRLLSIQGTTLAKCKDFSNEQMALEEKIKNIIENSQETPISLLGDVIVGTPASIPATIASSDPKVIEKELEGYIDENTLYWEKTTRPAQ